MSTEEPLQEAPPAADVDAPMQDSPTAPAPAATGARRPRLNLNAQSAGGGERGERKRGKSMFGVLVNTLNKAKAEDKERNASEAAKKRQLIEQRLQNKLKKDADSIRQVEEAKRDKVIASRKEEDLQLRDSIHKLRRTRLPLLSNFLLTSDVIPSTTDADMDSDFQLSSLLPARSHPPPLYYLPAILTPEQEVFLSRRKAQTKEAAEKEWEQFTIDRAAGIEEVVALRQKVAAVRNGQSKAGEQQNGSGDHTVHSTEEAPVATAADASTDDIAASGDKSGDAGTKDSGMDVDDGAKEESSRESQVRSENERERPMGPPPAADEDDAVEY